MKITCSKRDEILKQKEEWEAERDAALAKRREENQAFDNALRAVTNSIKEDLEHMLSHYRALKFNVIVNKMFDDMLAVTVQCNERNKFDEDVALSWNYRAVMSKDGQIQKETGSWSGLKATTEAQMQSLTETLEALKYLNSIDWAILLNKDLPNYKDYDKTDTSKYYRDVPNFNHMLLEADIEELIGKDILISGASDINGRGRFYYMILRQTPSQYEIASIPDYVVHDQRVDLKEAVEERKKFSHKIKKSKLFDLIDQPIETLEVM